MWLDVGIHTGVGGVRAEEVAAVAAAAMVGLGFGGLSTRRSWAGGLGLGVVGARGWGSAACCSKNRRLQHQWRPSLHLHLHLSLLLDVRHNHPCEKVRGLLINQITSRLLLHLTHSCIGICGALRCRQKRLPPRAYICQIRGYTRVMDNSAVAVRAASP